MGSVQSYVTCPKCKNPEAFEDYYYKTDEVYVFCDKCGYYYSRTALLDKARGEKIRMRVEKLIGLGKLDNAIKVAGLSGMIKFIPVDGKPNEIPIKEWSAEEKIEALRNIFYETFFKLDKKGRVVYETEEGGGVGAYRYKLKGKIATCLGRFRNEKDKEDFKKWFEENKEKLEEAKFTEKIGLVWDEINLLKRKGTKGIAEIFSNKSI